MESLLRDYIKTGDTKLRNKLFDELNLDSQDKVEEFYLLVDKAKRDSESFNELLRFAEGIPSPEYYM